MITGSADKTVKIIDILSGFKMFSTLETSDAVFTLETVYNLTIAGCGDGNLVVFDNDNGECLYGLVCFLLELRNHILIISFGAMSKGGIHNIRCLKQ